MTTFTVTEFIKLTEKGELLVTQAGITEVKSSNVTCTAEAAKLVATPLSGRKMIYIRNNDAANEVFVGGSAVSIANGFHIPAATTLPFPLFATDDVDIYGVCSALETADIRVLEVA